MKALLLVLSLLFITNAIASIKIVEILNDEEILLLASDGLVYELKTDDNAEINFAYEAMESQLDVELKKPLINLKRIFDEREIVTGFKKVQTETPKNITFNNQKSSVPTPLNNFEVTSVGSFEDSKSLFKTMTTRTKRRSQCYNRAHVWSHRLSKVEVAGKKLNLGKTWIFFSRKYIKEYKYKWWFHIAPYIKLQGENGPYVMDRKFTREPLKLQGWTNVFMKNNAQCKEVIYYSDYRQNQGQAWCFIIKSSMYYWQPKNIEALEAGAEEKKSFVESELRKAYKDAVKRWNGELE